MVMPTVLLFQCKHLQIAKYDGIVLAGVGDGNFYKDVFDVALKAVNNGINVVRSSRVPFGPTNLNGEVDDAKYHSLLR